MYDMDTSPITDRPVFPSMPAVRRVLIHGRVQGVFFRDSTRRRAEPRNVHGWIRNVADGTVEAHFEGEPEDVQALVEWCGEGPRGAEVEHVEVSEVPAEGLGRFEVR
jgi:acylphosphatase